MISEFKTMIFALKTMIFALKTMIFALKTMNFWIKNDELCIINDECCIQNRQILTDEPTRWCEQRLCGIRIENDEMCVSTDGMCVSTDELRIEMMNFVFKMMNLVFKIGKDWLVWAAAVWRAADVIAWLWMCIALCHRGAKVAALTANNTAALMENHWRIFIYTWAVYNWRCPTRTLTRWSSIFQRGLL